MPEALEGHSLSPFAFPAETDVRFTLLLVAAAMLAVVIGGLIPMVLDPDRPPLAIPTLPDTDVRDPQQLRTAQEAAVAGLRAALGALVFPAGLALATMALAGVLFRLYPGWLRRGRGLQPPSTPDPVLFEEVEKLALGAGLPAAPRIELGPDLKSQRAQVFGSDRDPVLGLDRGLQLLLRKAPLVFRAILLHELGHVANRDVGRTYFAQSLWIAAIVTSVGPLTLLVASLFVGDWLATLVQGGAIDTTRLFTRSLPTVALVYAQVALILAVVAAVRAGLLRTRELYADSWAALSGARETLAQVLARNQAAGQADRGLSPWRLHPSLTERTATLRDTRSLFRLTNDLPFTTGFLLAFVLAGLVPLLLSLALAWAAVSFSTAAAMAARLLDSPGSGLPIPVDLYRVIDVAVFVGLVAFPVVGAAYLVSGTVGLQVQRQAVADAVSGLRGLRPYLRLVLPALWVALGLEAGFLVTPFALFSPLGVFIGRGSTVDPLFFLGWVLAFAAGTFLCLCYVRFFAKRVLGRSAGPRPPAAKRLALTAAASLLLLLFYLPLVAVRAYGFYYTGADKADPTAPLLATFLIACVFLALASALTWLVCRLTRGAPSCPSCGLKNPTPPQTPTDRCHACNTLLASWLFLPTPATPR